MSVQASAFRSPVESQLPQSASLSESHESHESQQNAATRFIIGAIEFDNKNNIKNVYEIKAVNGYYKFEKIKNQDEKQQVIKAFMNAQKLDTNGRAKIPQYEIKSTGSNSKPMDIKEINKALKKQKANANIDRAFNKLQNSNNTTADLTQAFKAFFEPSGLTVREIHQQENKHKQKQVDREFTSGNRSRRSSVPDDDDTAPQAHKPVGAFQKEEPVIVELNDDDDELPPPDAAACAPQVQKANGVGTTTVEVEANS